MADMYCYANTKKEKKEVINFPLTFKEIGQGQSEDSDLMSKVLAKPKLYSIKKFLSAGKN